MIDISRLCEFIKLGSKESSLFLRVRMETSFFCNFFVFCQFDKKYKIRTSRLHWVRKLFFSFSALRFSFNILFLFDIMYISIVLIGWLSLKSSIKKFRCSRKRWPHKSLLPKFAISLICTLVFHLTFHMSLQYFYLKWSII